MVTNFKNWYRKEVPKAETKERGSDFGSVAIDSAKEPLLLKNSNTVREKGRPVRLSQRESWLRV